MPWFNKRDDCGWFPRVTPRYPLPPHDYGYWTAFDREMAKAFHIELGDFPEVRQ